MGGLSLPLVNRYPLAALRFDDRSALWLDFGTMWHVISLRRRTAVTPSGCHTVKTLLKSLAASRETGVYSCKVFIKSSQ